jgi:hypothetical protein
MQDQKSDLEAVIQKYQHIIDTLGKQVEDAKNNIRIAQAALQLLQQESIIGQSKLFEIPPSKVSDKYSGSTMRNAIMDILKYHPEESLTGQEIYDELIKNGFHSRSKNIRRDVYIALNRFKKADEIICIKEGGRNKYTLKKKQ